MRLFDIIIPTWNNANDLNQCVRSILSSTALRDGFGHIIIVNNGKQPCKSDYAHLKDVTVLDTPENLGWEGGLKLGLEHSKTPFVCFQNDDTFIPQNIFDFYTNLIAPFKDENVGCVGPVTTTAAGAQSIFHPMSPLSLTQSKWLIFFCAMFKREAIDKSGGIDSTLPGGDDFDLSIRLRQHGYKIFIQPKSFIIHYGFKTGTRVHGDHTVAGGWNSPQMTERTNHALIRKHGFRAFFETISGQLYTYEDTTYQKDLEGESIRYLYPDYKDKTILELGCGGIKTFPNSIGVDRVSQEKNIQFLPNVKSVADINADVSKPLPIESNFYDLVIARHILEHCVDTVDVLSNWKQVIKPGGSIIIAVPNENIVPSIPLNPEHVHAFTPESLSRILKLLCFTNITMIDPKNGMSFIMMAQKETVYTMDRMYEGDVTTIPITQTITSSLYGANHA